MKPRILFVDDNEDARELIAYVLKSLGYEVVVSDCPSGGLRLARDGHFDLYLLDSRFAEGSGAELCEAIRGFDAATPIIFFTGEHPSRLTVAEGCHVQGVVMKPEFDKLMDKITSTLRPAA